MTISPAGPRWGPLTVALLTVAWVLGMLLAAAQWFAVGLEMWAEPSDEGARPAELHHQGVVVACVAVGGAVLIATVAFAHRMARAGAVYLVLAMALGMLALVFELSGEGPAPSPEPTVCQEYSGSDTRCPGG